MKYEPKVTSEQRRLATGYGVGLVTDLAHCEACLQETQKELYRRNAQLEQALAEKQLLSDQLLQEINDSCQVDTDVRTEAKKVLPAAKVDGDSYAVPDVVEIVAMLVKEVERLKGIMKELPEGWSGPFCAEPHSEYSSVYCLCDATIDRSLAVYLSKSEATFLANLLNACYPAKENH